MSLDQIVIAWNGVEATTKKKRIRSMDDLDAFEKLGKARRPRQVKAALKRMGL